jgi:hypothetical protein
MHRYRENVRRQTPRRTELVALRDEIERVRARIIAALSIKVGNNRLSRDGNDIGMLKLTRTFFDKLTSNLDRQIADTAGRQANARKAERDECWEELLFIWRELGGKPYGSAAADFLLTASQPLMRSSVPTHKSILQWLDRRRDKPSKPVRRPILRHVA